MVLPFWLCCLKFASKDTEWTKEGDLKNMLGLFIIRKNQVQGRCVDSSLSPLFTNLSYWRSCTLRDLIAEGLKIHGNVVFVLLFSQQLLKVFHAENVGVVIWGWCRSENKAYHGIQFPHCLYDWFWINLPFSLNIVSVNPPGTRTINFPLNYIR
jgi:hypothetical protein